MTVQEVKEKLNSVRTKYREYVLARDKAEQFCAMISAPTLVQSGEPRSEHSGNAAENRLIAALWYSERASRAFQEYMLLRNEVEDIISGLRSLDEREVLTRRYIIQQKWDDIAESMHYTRQHITRIHGSALTHFS